MLAGVASLLVLAVIAGSSRLEQRGTAREQAVAADAQRLGARALAEDDLDLGLLLARQGVALDDSVQTRGSLLAALLKSPAALGVLPRRRRAHDDDRPQPRPAHARRRQPPTRSSCSTRARGGASGCSSHAESGITAELAFTPDGSRLAVGYDVATGATVAVLDVRTGRVVARMTRQPTGCTSGLSYSARRAHGGRDPRVLGPCARRGRRAHALRRAYGRGDGSARAINREGVTSADDHERRAPPGRGGEDRDHPAMRETLRVLKRWPVGGRDVSQYGPPPSAPTTARWRSAGRRLGAAARPADRSGADGGGPPRRVDLQRRLHPGRSHTRDHGRGRRRDPLHVGRATTGETLVRARRAHPPPRSPGTEEPSTPPARVDGRVRLGPRRTAASADRSGTGASSSDRSVFVPLGPAPLALSSDGRLIASGQDDGAISIVNARTLARREPFPVATGPRPWARLRARQPPLDPAARRVSSRAWTSTVDGCVSRLRGHRGEVLPPAISADGRLLVTGSDDRRSGCGPCRTRGRWASHCGLVARSATSRSARTGAG